MYNFTYTASAGCWPMISHLFQVNGEDGIIYTFFAPQSPGGLLK